MLLEVARAKLPYTTYTGAAPRAGNGAAAAVTGVIYMIPALVALASINFAVIVFPGPILGVIFGLAILGLGAAKGVRTARTAVVAAAE